MSEHTPSENSPFEIIAPKNKTIVVGFGEERLTYGIKNNGDTIVRIYKVKVEAGVFSQYISVVQTPTLIAPNGIENLVVAIDLPVDTFKEKGFLYLKFAIAYDFDPISVAEVLTDDNFSGDQKMIALDKGKEVEIENE